MQNRQVKMMRLPRAFARTGLQRFVRPLISEDALPAPFMALPPETRSAYLTLMLQHKWLDASVSELESLPDSAAQVRAVGNLGDLPLVVLHARESVDPAQAVPGMRLPPDLSVEEIDAMLAGMQAELAGLTTNSTRIVSEEGSHALPLERPHLAAEAIRQAVEAVRKGRRLGQACGDEDPLRRAATAVPGNDPAQPGRP